MRPTLLPVVLIVILSTSAYAQRSTLTKHFGRPDVGLSLRFHTLANSDTVAANDLDSRFDALSVGALVGLNFPIVKLADNFTLGLNPSGEIGAVMNSGWGMEASLDFPVFAVLKYGTDATWEGTRDGFGFTAGIGYNYSVLISEARLFTYGLPAFMAEINVGKRRTAFGLFKIRYASTIGTNRQDFSSSGDTFPIFFNNHSFHLILTPAY